MPRTLSFSGLTWDVRLSGRGGPGPNHWDENNVHVDRRGRLHLAIRKREERWTCAELQTRERLGFGTYRFQIVGRLDQFDPNIVLGLFNYPTRDIGPDATHEIDIEFAHWGQKRFPPGNYTVWPAVAGEKQTSETFNFTQRTDRTTHRFVWQADSVAYLSQHGHRAHDEIDPIHAWTFRPPDPERRIARQPMPLHLNLWLFQGRPPEDSKEVEIVIPRVEFTPR